MLHHFAQQRQVRAIGQQSDRHLLIRQLEPSPLASLAPSPAIAGDPEFVHPNRMKESKDGARHQEFALLSHCDPQPLSLKQLGVVVHRTIRPLLPVCIGVVTTLEQDRSPLGQDQQRHQKDHKQRKNTRPRILDLQGWKSNDCNAND